jgi:hypothetical protein
MLGDGNSGVGKIARWLGVRWGVCDQTVGKEADSVGVKV